MTNIFTDKHKYIYGYQKYINGCGGKIFTAMKNKFTATRNNIYDNKKLFKAKKKTIYGSEHSFFKYTAMEYSYKYCYSASNVTSQWSDKVTHTQSKLKGFSGNCSCEELLSLLCLDSF